MDEQKNAADTIATAAQLANESGAALLYAQLKWLDDYVIALLARVEAAESQLRECEASFSEVEAAAVRARGALQAAEEREKQWKRLYEVASKYRDGLAEEITLVLDDLSAHKETVA